MLADRVRISLLDVGVKPEDIADENCQVATDADFSGTSNGTFRYIGTATRLVIPHEIKGVQVISYVNMFSDSTALITEVRSNNPNVTDIGNMFNGCSSLTSLDLSNFDTSKVTNMGSMFRECTSLTSLDVSNFDTSKVTFMNYMFYNCNSLTSLDLSNFDTSNVINVNSMFRDCALLATLDLSSFDTSNITNMSYMFRGCRELTTLDLSSFDTSKVTSLSYMFYRCTSVVEAYARTQGDADKFNSSSNKPSNVNFVVK